MAASKNHRFTFQHRRFYALVPMLRCRKLINQWDIADKELSARCAGVRGALVPNAKLRREINIPPVEQEAGPSTDEVLSFSHRAEKKAASLSLVG